LAEQQDRSLGIRPIRLFSLFGFEVKLDLSWLLLAFLISWSLGAGLFPNEYPGLSNFAYAWMGLAVAVGVFLSIVLHEFAHSIVARHLGIPIRGITLFIFGGVAEMTREPPSARSEFLMAIAGPIASFLLAYVFWNLAVLPAGWNWAVPVNGVFYTLALINLTVAVFNLVPAFPLDGGRVLRAALWHVKKDLQSATYISSQIGRGFGFFLMILGAISFLRGNLIGGMWWFLIGMFVRGAAAGSYQQLIVSDMFKDKPVLQFMKRDPITVPPSITIEAWLEDYVYPHHYKMYPVVDDGRLLGSISIAAIRTLPKADRKMKHVRDIMEPVSGANSIPADMSTSELMTAMVQGTGKARYMVVDNGHLVGMISLKDLLELISLKLQIESSGS